jgi:hypothetical protein
MNLNKTYYKAWHYLTTARKPSYRSYHLWRGRLARGREGILPAAV